VSYLAERLENYKNILDRYESKAEKLRQAHGDLYIKYKTYNDIVTIITISLSALITFLSLTDLAKILAPFNLNTYIDKINPFFSLFLALFGFIIFIFSLFNFVFGWQDKYLKHESGVKLLTNYITDIKDLNSLLEDDLQLNVKIESNIKEVNERYLLVCDILPLISDQDFLNSKQKYIIKRRISEQLDGEPCTDANINKYLKNCKHNKHTKNK